MHIKRTLWFFSIKRDKGVAIQMFQSSVILVLNSNMHYVANLQDKRNEKIWLEYNDLLCNYSFEIVSYEISASLINSHECFFIPTPNKT